MKQLDLVSGLSVEPAYGLERMRATGFDFRLTQALFLTLNP